MGTQYIHTGPRVSKTSRVYARCLAPEAVSSGLCIGHMKPVVGGMTGEHVCVTNQSQSVFSQIYD
jgi:hypothetical protein